MKILDLFAGCGGLSEGFSDGFFDIVAHVEMDKNACDSIKTRTCYRKLKKSNNLDYYNDYLENRISKQELHGILSREDKARIINEEINSKSIEKIFTIIDELKESNEINGIIGGPPCQAYSMIGRAMNKRIIKSDSRIYLYEYYVEFLKKYNPDFFLFENVKGLLSFKDQHSQKLFPKIILEFEKCGYDVTSKLIDVSEYGVSQKRERLFIFGLKTKNTKYKFNDLPYFSILEKFKEPPICVNDLLIDLPVLRDGEVSNKYNGKQPPSIVSNYFRSENLSLSLNISRKHNERDKKIYKLALKKKMEGVQLKYYDLPLNLRTHKNTSSFVDRYKAIDGKKVSHTIVAHISKDGHYYIHPDIKQNRSITVREAARIQGFPDSFYFENSRSAAFKQIGNAVPPYFSHKLAVALLDKLTN